MEDEEKSLVLFSGGKDSLVVALRLLDSNYKLYLVTYENGCGLKAENVNNTIERLIKKYGSAKIENIGIKNIAGFFREFIYPFYNYTSSYIKENYGDITISQFNCLACRLSMYIASIILCNQYNIRKVFDGARRSQLFAIEQKEMLKKLNEYEMEVAKEHDFWNKMFYKLGVYNCAEMKEILLNKIYSKENAKSFFDEYTDNFMEYFEEHKMKTLKDREDYEKISNKI